ncbi:MAG: hypothetical protein QMD92_00495 [bacterium]|nr:hypothetical protein [bacterium]
MSGVTPIIVFLFAKKNFDIKTAIFSIFWVFISPTYYRLNTDLFNNLISEIFVILSFTVISLNLKNIFKFIISGIFLGLAFWSHTLTPIVGISIFIFDGLIKLITTKKAQALIHYTFVIMVGVVSSLPQSIPFLFKSPTGPNDPEFYITPLLVDSFSKFLKYISNSFKNPQTIFNTLNIFTNILFEWVTPIIILFTIGGIILLIKNKVITKKSLIISALIIPLGLTLMSSAGLIGFNDRFIQYVFFPTAILSSYFLVNIPKIILRKVPYLNKSPFITKLLTAVIFTIIAITMYPKQITQVLSREPSINISTYNIFKETQKYISQNDLILINNINFYWFKQANPNYNISIYEYYVTQYISEGNKDFGYYNSTAEYSTNAYLIAKNSSLSYNETITGLCSLKESKKTDKLFIFFDREEPGFDANRIINHTDDFIQIFNLDKYYLFLLNNLSCLNK